MTEREALACMIVFLYLSCLASAWLSFTNLLLTGTALAAAFCYTITKTHTFLGNISRGIPCGIAVLAGIIASERGTIAHPQHLPFLVLLPLLFILHDATTNLIGTIRDIEGDRAGKCITLPVKYGLRPAILTAISLTISWELLASLLPALFPMHTWDFYSFYSVALIISVIAFIVLIHQPDNRANALLSHKLFIAERVLLAGALLAGAVGIVPAAAVVLPLLTLTLLSQKMMRDRYEFPAVIPIS
jgi:4-hydroxybenzoate polyprenyltransferase/geranylgeranylglycerol-phosphate geranylgeranyltransferase